MKPLLLGIVLGIGLAALFSNGGIGRDWAQAIYDEAVIG